MAGATSLTPKNSPEQFPEARDNLRDAIELLLEANRELTGKRSPGKKVTREKIKISVA